jgi:hypothetical protein
MTKRVDSLDSQPVDFIQSRQMIAPIYPHTPHLPHNPHTALTGTWCAPGIRKGGGAGSVVLTVARLGDEP